METGEIAEGGFRPRGTGAASIAVGAESRPSREDGVTELAEIDRLHRLEDASRMRVLTELVGVPHRDTAGGDPFVTPDRMEQALVGREPLCFQVGDVLGDPLE